MLHSETLKSGGVSARYVHLDVTDSKSIVSAKDIIEKAEGHLDSLVNNAGVAFFEKPQKATEVGTAAVVREACNVNLFGLIETTTVFLPLLLASKSTPSIVNITTGMASNTWMANNEVPNDFLRGVAYNSSKAGANSFTISLAHELRGKAVVTALTPGFTTTKLNHFHPGGKTPREAAEGIVPWALENDASKTGKCWIFYLCSEDSVLIELR